MMVLLPLLCFFAVFGAVALFAWFGFDLFSRGWQSYEEKYVKGAERSLDAMYLTIPPRHILFLSLVSMILVLGLGVLAFGNLPLSLILGLLALPLPGIVLFVLKRRRDHMFSIQLVDALVSMGNALRAGLSLPMAVELLAREMPNPMGQEMRLVAQEMRLGVDMEVALRHLYLRMPGEDLDLLITSISVSREVGGNLTEIFDNIAVTIRERHRIHGKIAALTAQGKLQGIVVGSLPIGIFLFLHIWNADLVRPMYHSALGILMIVIAVVMEALGAYFIWRVTKIDV
jgi:tight adherence protein B